MRTVSTVAFVSNDGTLHPNARDALVNDLRDAGSLEGVYGAVRDALYANDARRDSACNYADKEIDRAFETLRSYRAIVAGVRGIKP